MSADGIDDAAVVHRRMFHALRDATLGRSLSFAYFADSDPARIAAAFEPADHRRLVELAHRFDPGNVFRLGQAVVRGTGRG